MHSRGTQLQKYAYLLAQNILHERHLHAYTRSFMFGVVQVSCGKAGHDASATAGKQWTAWPVLGAPGFDRYLTVYEQQEERDGKYNQAHQGICAFTRWQYCACITARDLSHAHTHLSRSHTHVSLFYTRLSRSHMHVPAPTQARHVQRSMSALFRTCPACTLAKLKVVRKSQTHPRQNQCYFQSCQP
jgi:hypothetical protein